MRNWWWVKEKKKKQMALLLITVTMILQFQMKGCVGCVETERMGLLQLKSYLSSVLSPEDEESILKSWSDDDDPKSDCCNWDRVTCSHEATGGYIVNLSLSEIVVDSMYHSNFNQPKGLNLSLLHSFPQLKTLNFSYNWFDHLFDPIHGYKSFQRLENLETLDFRSNHFNNSVLSFLSSARSLRILNLGDNRLGGVFSLNGFEHLVELEVLSLSQNQFNHTRSIQELKDMPKLQEVDLSRNEFTDLDSLGLVFPSSLQVLNLRDNQLSVTHEGYSKLCGLTNLRELGLSNNALTSMPYCLGNLSRLRTLDLSKNQLNGNLSAFMSSLPPELEYLSLLDNNFNGSFLFNSLVNQTRLTVFRLSSKVGVIQAHPENVWVPLFQLKMLQLQNMSLGSTIPGFLVHQHDLCFIDLSHNQLRGAFPTWLVQNNSRLEAILLNSNLLTELQLPRRVHGLQVLDISSNKIYNSIQEDIGFIFPKLRYMNFSSNQFHGTIPSSMGEMKSLEMLDMSFNSLSGELPKPFLSGCYSLRFLKLSNNQFHGEIFPDEHANLTGLYMLLLDGNNFNGSLGKGLLKSKFLFFLDVSGNRFSGEVPLWMGMMSSLWYLYMSDNQLKGHFPHQLQSLQLLQVMDISHNSFYGLIPRNVSFSSLKQLRLQNNSFMGPIPETLFEAERLQVLDLRNNNFSGKMIMNTLGMRSGLRVLLLRNNNLQSHIPEKICQLSKVLLMDLSHNMFNGVIPSCLGNMSFGAKRFESFEDRWPWEYNLGFTIQILRNWSYTSDLNLVSNLERNVDFTGGTPFVDFLTKNRYEAYQGNILHYMYGLDLSRNQLSGEIPAEIRDLENIRSLNFSRNRLTGSIPYNISKLKNLESLDLSNNNLYGNIPPVLADLNSLGYFNVSCNNLSGEIPFKGHLVTFDERSYIGNAHLCGRPINISCNPMRVPEANASKEAEEEEDDDVIDMVWFYWTCGAVYMATTLSLFAFLCIDTRWSQEWFYRVDLFIHHLQRYKRSAFGN